MILPKEEQVASLKLSQELTKYIKLDTQDYWENTVGQKDKSCWKIVTRKNCQFYDKWLEYFPAPSIAELMNILPLFRTERIHPLIFKCWCPLVKDAEGEWLRFEEHTPANALCLMLIYLYGNDLLEVGV